VEPFVVILLILAFSILDAIGKAQKKRQQEGGAADARGGPEAEAAPDQAASQAAMLEAARRRAASRRSGAPRVGTSEDVIVPELWEEIKKLARGRGVETLPERPREVPARVERPPRQGPRRAAPVAAHPTAPAPAPVHPVHKTHPLMGKPLAERRSPLDAPLTAASRHPSSQEVKDVRAMLGGGPDALRRAVMLEEVLGPPAAMRGDPWEPGG